MKAVGGAVIFNMQAACYAICDLIAIFPPLWGRSKKWYISIIKLLNRWPIPPKNMEDNFDGDI